MSTDMSQHAAESRCENCGAFVTKDFARVFGNNHNEVFGCLDCMSSTDVKRGRARAENVESTYIGSGRQ